MLHEWTGSPARSRAPARSLVRVLVAAWLTGSPALAGGWSHSHGDATGTGFVDVVTRPPLRPERTVPGIGSYAPGSGPVIGPDGTVHLGDQQGRLRAFRRDGTPLWMRELGGTHRILASPAVDVDGMVYVVGFRELRDHRGGRNDIVWGSTLFRFTPGGGMLAPVPFPEHNPSSPTARGRGRTSAAPVIWRSGAEAAVIVPAIYERPGGSEVRLLAFSPNGFWLADIRVAAIGSTVTGGGDRPGWAVVLCTLTLSCWIPVPEFSPGTAPPPGDGLGGDAIPPDPSVAIVPRPGAAPAVAVALRSGPTVVYGFSPGAGFTELFRRVETDRVATAGPIALADGTIVVPTARKGADGVLSQPRITFTRTDGARLADIAASLTLAPLTRSADGKLVSVTRFQGLELFRHPNRVLTVPLSRHSIAPAAASRRHVFVSTATGLHSFDATTMAEVGRLDWVGGGRSPPAIGPDGRVYALASDILFVWPGAPQPCRGLCVPRGGVIAAR